MLCSLSIFVIARATGLATPLLTQEEPITEQGYEREELGVNAYTTPSIARVFQQLDEFRPLPFEHNLGHVLMREARGLGVADRVTRHSASLTELARRGDWPAVRKELIATQADIEHAMIELRDQKMAHLITLGGWLRGLEISTAAIELDFSPQQANVLAQQDSSRSLRRRIENTVANAGAHAAL